MSNTIDNESLSFVFKKLQGYPNTDIGLDYNQEPIVGIITIKYF